jgi:hypothetical protein
VKNALPGLLACTLLAAPVAAEQPRLSNGRLETHPAAAGLEAAVRPLLRAATSPVWIGWAAASDRDRQMCCGDSWRDNGCCSGCRLEGGSGNWSSSTSAKDGVVKLEGEREMFVLLRAEGGELTKLRTFSPDCALDAGGTTLHWLEGVRPADSVRFLLGLADDKGGGRVTQKLADQALSALAFHAEPTAIDALIDRARKADSTHLRGQALFWLAQRAGDKAVHTIARALDEDPETDVKKKAVFALSQLPKDEGVPLLIQTARANKNPAVRKQAFFWLGQSKDSRALAFFEEVLK